MSNRNKVNRCFLSVTLSMFMLALAANVTPVTDLEGIAAQSAVVVSEPERGGMLAAGTPHGPIAIDGDANFSDMALLEAWPGDGSPENPYIIDGLNIDLDGRRGSCISVSNTRVCFITSNCNLTGAYQNYMDWIQSQGAGINLENVTGGELVNNTCNRNDFGIILYDSDYNTVANNTCNNNTIGICFGNPIMENMLGDSDSNTVANNTCSSNEYGISLWDSDYNTIANNTCNNNRDGIVIGESDYNTVVNNTCTSYGRDFTHGIRLYDSHDDTVANNTCNNNGDGIVIDESNYNTVVNNTCNNNWNGIFLDGSDSNTMANNTCSYNGDGIYIGNSNSSIVMYNICNNNSIGIHLTYSDSSTVVNNTCSSNDIGISLRDSDYNTIANNTCNSNTEYGIGLEYSQNNTVANNTCNSNTEYGIGLEYSQNNTVANNTCSYNMVGIYLYESYYSTMANNTCFNNTEHDILEEFESGKFVPLVFLLVGLLGVTPGAIVVLGPGLRKAFEAWQLEGNNRREAYDEERRRWEADQEARLVEERRKRRYKDDITYPGVVRRFTIILMGRSIDLFFWIKMAVAILILFIIPIEITYFDSFITDYYEISVSSVLIDYNDSRDSYSPPLTISHPMTLAIAFLICIPAILLNRKIRNQNSTEPIRDAALAAYFGTAVLAIYFVQHFPPAELLWLVQTSPDLKLLPFGTLVMAILIVLPLIIRESSHPDFQAKHRILACAIGFVTTLVPVGMTAVFSREYTLYSLLSLCYIFGYGMSVGATGLPWQPVTQISINFYALSPMDSLYYLTYLLLHLLFGFSILRYLKGLISRQRVLLIGISSILLPYIAAFPGIVFGAQVPTIVLPVPVLLIMGTITIVSSDPIVKHQAEFSGTKSDKAAAISHPESSIEVPLSYMIRSKFIGAKRRIAELMGRT
ncbi:MAG: right-handed parallel beta-helix repeat-containing protein [Promethearchaeota archaeon]